MTRTLTTLTAAGALCVASFAAATPARAMDPWTAAAWFVGGAFVGSLFYAPYAYGNTYGYAGSYGYAPVGYRTAYVGGWAPPSYCYPAKVLQGGVYRTAQVCY